MIKITNYRKKANFSPKILPHRTNMRYYMHNHLLSNPMSVPFTIELTKELVALLPKARRKPVALSKNGKTAAFLVSARVYEELQSALEFADNFDGELSQKEERALAKRADAAMKSGTIGVRASRKLHEDIRRASATQRVKKISRQIKNAA